MAEDVRKWLADLGCERYHPIFVQNGFTSVSSLNGLNDSTLDRMAVINPSHRQAILKKAKSANVTASSDFNMDFDAIMGDLTSAIADLESIPVPTNPPPKTASFSTNPSSYDTGVRPRIGTASGSSSGSSTPQGGGTPHNSLSRQEKKPIQGQGNLQANLKGGDFDLDALLDDLCEFDPMKEVGGKSSPAAQPSPQHVQVLRPANHPSPQHQMPPQVMQPQQHTPSPPTTITRQSHTTTVVQNGMKQSPSVGGDSEGNLVDGGSTGSSSANNSLPRPTKEGEGIHVTPVHQPKLEGASDQISKEEIERRLEVRTQELRQEGLSEEEVQAKMKDEKMMIALEKMKLANKKKEVIKVFNNDGSNKTVVIEEGMTGAVVCYLLVSKNHFEESPNWTLIERLGNVGLERDIEDHENVAEIYAHWARDADNKFFFKRNDLKYELFMDPIKYFPSLLTNTMIGKDNKHRADKARKILVQEYFTSALKVPEIEGYLQLKDGYKNKWKKIYVILRASGIYHTLKGKAKTAKNLALLVQFDEYELFKGIDFKRLLKAPTDFCFAMRPKPTQMVPGAKDIKVLCADSLEEYHSWFAGIRLAKHGHALYDNYYKAHVKQFKLEEADKEDTESGIEQRAYSLTGMRLEKHLNKKREMYNKEKTAKEEQQNMFRKGGLLKADDPQDPESPKVPPKPSPKPVKVGGATGGESPISYPPPSHPAPPNPSSTPPAPQPFEKLSQRPWYHGAIPRDEAIKRLEQMGGADGVYLVRDSSSVPNSFVLTMFAKSVPKNFQIMPYENPDGTVVFRIDDGPAFKAVELVLNHYKEVADRLPCKLTEFCPRPPTRMTEC